MSYSTADSFIDFCRFHFDQIENIVFFGGEPLLNIKIIDYVCNSFESLYEKGKINKKLEYIKLHKDCYLAIKCNLMIAKIQYIG